MPRTAELDVVGTDGRLLVQPQICPRDGSSSLESRSLTTAKSGYGTNTSDQMSIVHHSELRLLLQKPTRRIPSPAVRRILAEVERRGIRCLLSSKYTSEEIPASGALRATCLTCASRYDELPRYRLAFRARSTTNATLEAAPTPVIDRPPASSPRLAPPCAARVVPGTARTALDGATGIRVGG